MSCDIVMVLLFHAISTCNLQLFKENQVTSNVVFINCINVVVSTSLPF